MITFTEVFIYLFPISHVSEVHHIVSFDATKNKTDVRNIQKFHIFFWLGTFP